MDYNQWWKWRGEIEQYPTLSLDKKQELLDQILNRTLKFGYHGDYAWAVRSMVEHMDIQTSLKLLSSCLGDKQDESLIGTVLCVLKRGADPKVIRNMLCVAPGDSARKAILCVDGIDTNEEEIGLRAISHSTHAPYNIFESKYSPSIDALKKLPPIMRLNTLEALTYRKNLPYNIFGKIKDEEEFKSLLFSASTKYLDRVNNMWEKYQESMNKGVLGLVTIKYFCDNCGDIEIKIKSQVLHSKMSVVGSRLNFLTAQWCAVCGHSNCEPSISGEILE